MPQGGGETITVYESDCTTPANSFDLGDTVCVKLTGAPFGTRVRRRLVIANPAGIVLAKVNVTADPQSVSLTLPSTASSTYEVNTVDNRGNWVVNSISTADGGVKASAWFAVHDPAVSVASLSVYKNPSSDTVASGAVVSFTVLVTNYGPDAATTVQLTEATPANTTFLSFSQDSGPTFTCTDPGSGGTGDTVCNLATLASGAEASFTFSYQVNSGLAENTLLSNTATVASATFERNPLDNTANSVVRVSAVAEVSACTLDCPADKTVTANTTQGGNPGAFVTYGAAAGNGDCGAITNDIPSGSFFPVGETTVTSSSGSGQSCTFKIIVVNTAAPTITCQSDITVNDGDNSGDENVTIVNPTFTPSGADLVGVRDDSTPAEYDEFGNLVTPGVNKPLTDPYPAGVTGITWTVTDDEGRTATCLQRITVIQGNRPPVTITCPANVSGTAPSGSCEATVATGTPTTNPSDGDVEVAAQRSDGQALADPFPGGTTTITWTAHDTITNTSASCTQTVTVTVPGDTTPPTLTVPANISTTTSSCSATVEELGEATATDSGSCNNGQVSISRSGVPPGFVFPTGTTNITYTATDGAGNTATGVQTVTVTESPAIPPTVTAPANVSVNTGPGATSCSAVVSDATLGTATASDNCPGVTVVRTGVPAGNIFPVGNTTVTYTATDQSGNTAQDTQTVTVVDNTVPDHHRAE